MPNGGVPIHLEFWRDAPKVGDIWWHQAGAQLELRRFTSISRSDSFEVSDVIVSTRVERNFLREVIETLLGRQETQAARDGQSEGDAVVFDGERVSVWYGSVEIGNISGDLLRVVAGFQAYWVDHDGVEVPRSLPIVFSDTATDQEGNRWTLRWNY